MLRSDILAALCALTIASLGCPGGPDSEADLGLDVGVDSGIADMEQEADARSADSGGVDTGTDSGADSGTDSGTDTGPDMELVNPEFCDPVAQNCVEPEAPVCGVIFPPNNMPLNFVCRESLGDVGEGEACTRPNDVVGEDDCAPGHLCTGYGLPIGDPQQRVCREFCQTPTACGDDAHCIWLHPLANLGMCMETCDPRGSDCVEGAKCSIFFSGADAKNFWICTNDSGANVGDSCSGSEQCGAGQWCPFSTNAAERTCTAFCADDIPCPNGETCVPNPQMPGYGACEQ